MGGGVSKNETPAPTHRSRRSYLRLILLEIWKRKQVDATQLPLPSYNIAKQPLEKQPLVGAERPQCELRRTVAGFDHTKVADFHDVFIILVLGDRVKGQFGFLVLDFERARGDGNLNAFLCQSCFCIEAPAGKANGTRLI